MGIAQPYRSLCPRSHIGECDGRILSVFVDVNWNPYEFIWFAGLDLFTSYLGIAQTYYFYMCLTNVLFLFS